MDLNLNNTQVILMLAASNIFIESLIASKGALIALKAENPPEHLIKQLEEELSEVDLALSEMKGIIDQFDKAQESINKEIDITTKPTWAK